VSATGRAAGTGLRFAIGTLTILPARAAGPPDRQTAAAAMVWAPALGAVLGALAAAVAVLARVAGASSTLAAVLAVASLAWLTRGLHLDGLADTADGLGSARPAAGALVVMQTSDIGPFGVLSVVLVLLAQVSALATALEAGRGPAALVLAAAVGRATLCLACRRGVPAARPGGLGAAVAGSVGPVGVVLALGGVLLLAAVAGVAGGHPGRDGIRSVVALAAALGAALWLRNKAVRRLGGVTGDVLGALVEVGTTVALVVLALG